MRYEEKEVDEEGEQGDEEGGDRENQDADQKFR